MQTTFLIVPKSVCIWFISISVRVTYMHTKMRKIMGRFFTGANANWTSEIKHQVNKSYLSFEIPLIVTCTRDIPCIVLTCNLQIGAVQ